MIVGVVLLAAFVWLESRVARPLLPLRLVLDRTRGGSFLAVFVIGMGMFSIFLFLTYYLQAGIGYSPIKTGLAFLPMVGGIVWVPAVVATPQLRGGDGRRISWKPEAPGQQAVGPRTGDILPACGSRNELCRGSQGCRHQHPNRRTMA
jgi:hypothetical protein